MRQLEQPAIQAIWLRVEETLEPLAAAAVAAAAPTAGRWSSRGSSGMSQAQYASLLQVAEDVEQALGRNPRMPGSAVTRGVPQMLFETTAALLALIAKRQQQQKQQAEVQEPLVTCSEAMLSAAAAMMRGMVPATQTQLAQAFAAKDFPQRFTAAMRNAAADLKAADAAAAAALAAGDQLPLQYRQQQRAVPEAVRMAMALITLYGELGWYGPEPYIVLPAAGLLLAAMRLALLLLAGNSRELSCKLLRVSTKPALATAALTHVDKSDDAALQYLKCSLELQQLQLLLLTMAIKVRCHEQHTPNSLSSSSDRRRQQQQLPSLDTARHRHLLAMLREGGISEQQAAAAPFPEVLTAASYTIRYI